MLCAGPACVHSPSMRARLRAVSDRVTIVHNDGKPYHLCEGGCPSASCFGPELALALTVAEADPTAEVLVVKQAGSGEALTDELHSSAGLARRSRGSNTQG